MPALRFGSLVTCIQALMLLTAACSGATSGTNDARTATLQAGDQQQAAASQPVATPPAIWIRNGANAPLPGVSVQWVVTAGGGSVTGGTSETDAQGIARVGSWTLGASGAQQLEAQVSGLAAVVFHATVNTGSTAAEVGKTFDAAGGTLEITEPGHPLQGLSLTVPAATFAAGGTIRVGVAAADSLPTLPPHLALVGPVLRIVTDLGRGAEIMTLRIPRTVTPGKKIVAIAYDPVRHVSEVLPIRSITANSVTVGSRHFRASLLDPTPSTGSGLRAAEPEQVTFLALVEILNAFATMQFEPEKHSWPIAENGSSAFVAGHGAAIASLQFWASNGQVPMTSLFSPMKVPGLYADTATLAAAMSAATRLTSFPADVQRGLTWLTGTSAAERDQYLYHAVQVRGYGPAHGLVLLALVDQLTNPTRTSMILVFDVGPNALLYYDPTEPGVVKQLVLGPNGFNPVSFRRTLDETPVMSAAVVPMGGPFFDVGQLGNLIFDMTNTLKADGPTKTSLNRLMAQLAGFPSVKLQLQAAGQSNGWRDAADTLDLYSQNDRIRAVTTGDIPQKLVFVDPAGNQSATSDAAGTVLASVLTNYGGIASGGTGRQRGAAVTPANNRMLVPLNLAFAKRTFTIDGEPIALQPNQVQYITARSNFRFPAGSVITWSWGDGTPTEQFDTRDAIPDTEGHKFQFTGQPPEKFTVIATLMSGRFGVVIAADTAYVENAAAPFWQITSFHDLDNLFDEAPDEGELEVGSLESLLAIPGAGLIGVTENGPTTEFFLLIKRVGTWTNAACCPPTFDNTERYTLGLSPTVNYSFGAFFSAFKTSSFAQSSTDLTAGTMTSQHAVGTTSWPIKNGGTQAGPDYFVKVAATRNGTTLSGTITFVNFGIDKATNLLDASEIENYRFQFTAARMR